MFVYNNAMIRVVYLIVTVGMLHQWIGIIALEVYYERFRTSAYLMYFFAIALYINSLYNQSNISPLPISIHSLY